MSPPGRRLPWDSQFFGFTVGQVVGGTLDLPRSRAILDWCTAEEVTLLYFLADDDVSSWAVAAEAGFRAVDLRVELVLDRAWPRLPAAVPLAPLVLREATEGDLGELLPIAASVHTDSRFFADPLVPRRQAQDLFRLWLRRSVEHAIADVVFVADLEGQAAGYLTATLADGAGRIGLVGVGEGARGRGIGLAMVQHALAWFAAGGAREVSVVTQGRNILAQRVYQRCGFLTNAVRVWFHRWGRQP